MNKAKSKWIHPLLFFVFYITFSANSNTPADGKIIVGGDRAYPPFEFINKDGNPDGFNIELIEALMEELGWEYEIRLTNRAEALSLLKVEKIDLMAGITEDRSLNADFALSVPHSYLHHNLICRKNSPFHSPGDLNNKRLIIQKEDAIAVQSERPDIAEYAIYVNDSYEGLEMLSKGKYDAMLCDDVVARKVIADKKLGNLEIKYLNILYPVGYCFATNKRNTRIIEQINHGLEQLKMKGVFNNIYNKWFTPAPQIPGTGHLKIILVLLILMTFAAIIIVIIKKYIKRVTDKYNLLNGEMSTAIRSTMLAIKTVDLIQWEYDCRTNLWKSLNDPAIKSGSHTDAFDYASIIHPADLHIIKSLQTRISQGEESDFSFDIRMRYPNIEEWQHVTVHGTAVRDSNGGVIKYIGFRQNNTRFVRLNEQLTEKNIYLDMALKAGNIIPIMVNLATEKIEISLLTETEEFLLPNGKKESTIDFVITNIHEEDQEKLKGLIGRIASGEIDKSGEEIRCRNVHGEEEFYSVNCMAMDVNPEGIPKKLIGYLQDISENKKAERELNNQREFMNKVLNVLPIPVHIYDMENGGSYVYWNDESEKLFGSGLNKRADQVLLEAEELMMINRQVYETEEPYENQEVIKLHNGKIIESFTHRMVIYNGEKKYVLIIRWDIGEKKEVYKKMKLLSLSTKSLKAYTWFCDMRDGVLTFGDGFDQTGGTADEMNDMQKFAQRIHPNDRQMFIDTMNKFCMQEDGEFSIAYQVDFAATGNYEWWECRGAIEQDESNGVKYKYLYGLDVNVDVHKRNEKILLENKHHLSNLIIQNEIILNNSNSGLAYIDNNYVVQWENLSAYKPNCSLTKNYKRGYVCYKVLKGRSTPCPGCIIQESRNSLQIEQKEVVADNSIFELMATPIFNGENNQVATVLKCVDITEKKRISLELETAKNRAEEANLLLNNIFDMLPCSVYVKDVSNGYKYLKANAYFYDSIGQTADKVDGKTDFDIFPNEQAEKFREADVLSTKNVKPYACVEETWWKDKYTIWQTTKSSVEAINGHKIVIGLSMDLTEKMEAYKQLEIAKEKAEQSNKLKSAFLANMSHEIRTPLNAIVGFSELMTAAIDEEEKEIYTNQIKVNNDLLLRLVNDILDLSKIEAGMLVFNPERFDVRLMFQDLDIFFGRSIKSPDVELLCEIPTDELFVELDKHRFRQVITNFVTNAIKFTSKGHIKLGYVPLNGGIRVYVSDTGVGISQDKKDKVFERFEKLNDFAQGTGLGMAICKAITDACHGKIGMESELGVGSTFWAWFPKKVE